MRILMTIHHPLDPNSGAPGVTLAIARALEQSGCTVDLYSFDEAFGNRRASLAQSIGFPARVAMHLARAGGAYDIVDASSGDAWLWAAAGRPGAATSGALVTRSHGLEHTADRVRRQEARSQGAPLRRRYYVYHGGFRLWEVKRSLQLADHVILLNETDLRIARAELGVAASRSTIVPHGASTAFFDRPIDDHAGAPIRLAFVGSWIERKGIATLVNVMEALIDAGTAAQLLLLGTKPEARVREAFPERVRDAIHIVPVFANATLPEYLAGADILLSMSRTEGFQLTLIEGMAAGLAPLSTLAGAAPQIIDHDRNGMLLPYGDVTAFTAAVTALAADRARLTAMRHAARAAAARYRWPEIAARTLDVYRSAIASRRRNGPS